MSWVEILIAVLSGLITAIPLVIKLVEYVKKAIKEKNWSVLIELVTDYMQIAENMFDTGAKRKEWVLKMVSESADKVNYDVDLDVISGLIDQFCHMSKTVNVPTQEG